MGASAAAHKEEKTPQALKPMVSLLLPPPPTLCSSLWVGLEPCRKPDSLSHTPPTAQQMPLIEKAFYLSISLQTQALVREGHSTLRHGMHLGHTDH